MELINLKFSGHLYRVVYQREEIETQQNEGNLPFDSLSPIKTADKDGKYCEALDWALKNRKRKNIKNIAITGPYGSGKSSIIQTFQERYKGKYEFLNISLATFKDESENKHKKNQFEAIQTPDRKKVQSNGDDKDILRLIELSILQQIFYHERDHKIPDSRFRKIKSLNWKLQWGYSIGLFFFATSLFNLFLHEYFVGSLLKISLTHFWTIFFHYISLLIVLGSLSVVAYKAIRIFSNLRISKLSLHSAEIEISDNISKSIFNHHLDEILYFFEVTDYNVVIIEDLDRFEQTEVFTKLREINLLINNSEKIKDEIVFIYAVRDEMFVENDRTKFFDFIIPVIPVINTSNSNEMLLNKCRINKYNISEDLIENLALFIDDMRLLHNIMNEFHIYYKKLNPRDQDKLLAIICYKNIFPDDFDRLNKNEGALYSMLQRKRELIKTRTTELDSKILGCKKKIKDLEQSQIRNIEDLNSIYTLKVVSKRPGFISFEYQNMSYAIDSVIKEDKFHILKDDKAQIKFFQEGYHRSQVGSIPQKFSQIEKEIDPNSSYEIRKNLIKDWTKDEIQNQRKEIERLEKDKSNLRALKLKDLIGNSEISIDLRDEKQTNLINILLRNGFINEDYLDYITLFYPGSVTREDQQFILNVKSLIPTDFDYKLTKIEKLISKLNPYDFDKEYVLNYNLLDFLLTHSSFVTQKNLLLNFLSSRNEKAESFIDGFIENGEHIELFIRELCNKYPSFWKFVNEQSAYTEEKKNNYLKLIIQHADPSALTVMAKDHKFDIEISLKENFLEIIPYKERIEEVVKVLNIQFKNLDKNRSPKDLLEFILRGHYFEMNVSNLRTLIEELGKYDHDDFEQRNYFAIENSECDELISFVGENLEEYIYEVYLQLDSNEKEPVETFTELLNTETLEIQTRKELIHYVRTKIPNLSEISDAEISNNLLKESKVIPIWRNVLHSYNEEGNSINNELLEFLNTPDNAKELSQHKIPSEVNGENIFGKLCPSLIHDNRLSDDCYSFLIKSIPWMYADINFEDMSKERVLLLINNNKVTPKIGSYKLLKEAHDGLNILLLEKNTSKFVKDAKLLDLDSFDIEKILGSTFITSSEKNIFLKDCLEEVIVANENNLKYIAELLLKNPDFETSNLVVERIILSKKVENSKRIILFHLHRDDWSFSYVAKFLLSMGEKYEKISNRNRRAIIENNRKNEILLDDLKSIGYISSYSITMKGLKVYHFNKLRK